jgi:hypothetical protein
MCLFQTAAILAFFLYTLLACDRFSRPFASACIALSALTPNRQTSSVANAPVTTDITQASYVLSNLPAQLTFNDAIAVDNLCYVAKLIFAELAGFRAFIDPGLFEYLLRGALAYADNIGQCNPDGLIIGNINTDYTRHISSFSYIVSCFTPGLYRKTIPGAACVAGLYKSPAQHLCDEQSYSSHIYVLQNF